MTTFSIIGCFHRGALRLCVLVLFFGCSSVPGFAAPDLSEYELAFSDEFNGAALSSQKWSTAPLWGPYLPTNMEEQFYVDKLGINPDHGYDPFSFTGSSLVISAEPVSTAGLPPEQPADNDPVWENYSEYTRNPDYSADQRAYLSGLISTVNSYNFTHGYVEARVKVPAGRGLWSAFWLLTSKYVEDVPEIDVMEFIGQEVNEVNHTLHYFDVENGWSLISSPTYKTTGPDYSADFHIYGLLWSPKELIWYVDGEEVKRITDQEFLVSKQSMYIISNLAVGGSWPGSPDSSTTFPANFELDYIRAYRKKPPTLVNAQSLDTDYQLMFSDEFDGNALDSNKWLTHLLWGPYLRINNEEQVYIDSLDRHAGFSVNPFDVSGGTLRITADNIASTNLPEQPDLNSAEWTLRPEQQYNPDYGTAWLPGYTSGALTSYDSFKFVNGYVEVRAKLPEGGGLWPAFWLLNGYYIGNLPEIDIMEMQGEAPQSIHQTYHYHDENGELVSSPTVINKNNGNYADGEFHTYAVQWQPGTIQWYIDGELTRTLNDDAVSTQLMYVILNMAVGGNFVGPVSSSFPKTMEIDYVRAYQLKPFSSASTGPNYSVALGNVGLGVAVDDLAEGNGFLLHSELALSSRFTTPAVYSGNAEHVIAVRYLNGNWQYNNNSRWTTFVPVSNDVLVAQVDFTSGAIADLAGENSSIGGITYGYSVGDLSFRGNRWAGVANGGEFEVTGTGFERNATVAGPISTLIGNTNNGIAVLDNATGQGYIMYSETNLATRFSTNPPYSGNASQLIAVINIDNQWYYNNNAGWVPFSIQTGDLLVASVNFGSHTIEGLAGQSIFVQGIPGGYSEGNLVFTADQWIGVSNYGEYGVSGIGFTPNEGSVTPGYQSAGVLGKGVAVLDSAKGSGFLMHSVEDVYSRFASDKPFPGGAQHFVAVRYVDSNWEYNNNANWVVFTSRPDDTLVASVDFSFDGLLSFANKNSTYKGMALGYATGDLNFTVNRWNGSANAGEFGISGSGFIKQTQSATTINIGSTGRGVAVLDNAVGSGYMMYSAMPLLQRFTNNPVYSDNASNIVAVRFNNGAWEYNNNWAWQAFEPMSGDRLLAEVNFTTDTVTMLEGSIGSIQAIDSGYSHGDIVLTANRWGYYSNVGEFHVRGTYFSMN